jgi:lantibiotic modifying enzyme
MHAWCHGAPGIGLGRLRLLRHLDDPTIRAEIEVALQSTLTAGFGYNHSLCHGDLGNLDLVLEAPGRSILNDGAHRSTGSPRRSSMALPTMDRVAATRWGWNRLVS